MLACPPLVPGQIVADKYVVEGVLGVGAMGFVVAARHLTLDRHVAIKVLRESALGSRDEAVARFLTEARAAASIDSDHVCRVFDVGTLPSGEPFMVMEHLEGNDLEAELTSYGQLPIVSAVDFVLQAADAIEAAHALGIVHRDLKPANLFVATRPDGSRRLKVLDFGISLSISREGARAGASGASLGTPAYMSPEQVWTPAEVDARSDVWALGAILYELLTGHTAFVGDSVSAVLDMVVHDDPCPINVLRRSVPWELEAIVMRCLDRDRDGRWQSAAELAAALTPFGSLSVAAQLAGVSGSLRVTAAPSVEPMVAAPRELITLPDEEELRARDSRLESWSALRARKRVAGVAVRVLAAATAVAAAISVLLHVGSTAPAADLAPAAPPAAEALPPPKAPPAPTAAVPPAVNVHDTSNSVHSAYGAPLAPAPGAAPSSAASGPLGALSGGPVAPR